MGKEKVIVAHRPFPLYSDVDVDVDISDDANEQSDVDELVAEPESTELKYVLCLSLRIHLTQYT